MADTPPKPMVCLPDDARRKIASSQSITCIDHVVEGLLRNALDARARTVTIDVHIPTGRVSVSDDGDGIGGAEFSETGHLADPHYTSKLESPDAYGRDGCFLADLAHLSLLSITSRHAHEHHVSRVVLHHGHVVARYGQLGADHPRWRDRGTLVEVYNVFGNLPVRAAARLGPESSASESRGAVVKLQRMVVGYLLAWPRSATLDVTLSVATPSRSRLRVRARHGADPFPLDTITSILSQAHLVGGADAAGWREASLHATDFSIRAAFSPTPRATKDVQFISFGHTPLLPQDSHLYTVVNGIFRRRGLGAPEGHDAPRTPAGPGRTSIPPADRWPMFCIRITTESNDTHRLVRHHGTLPEHTRLYDQVALALDCLIGHALSQHMGSHASGAAQAPSPAPSPSRRRADEHAPATSTSVHFRHWRQTKAGRDHLDGGLTKGGLLAGDDDDATTAPWESDRERPPGADDDLGDAHTTTTDRRLSRRNGRVDGVEPRDVAATGVVAAHAPRKSRTRRNGAFYEDECARSRSSGLDDDSSLPLTLGRGEEWAANQPAVGPITSVAEGSPPNAAGDVQDSLETNPISRGPRRRISKDSLAQARVIQQVDAKFVLAVVVQEQRDLLIAIDQHAADERVRYERLCRQLCRGRATPLVPPLSFDVDATEAGFLAQHRAYFRMWSITYTVASAGASANGGAAPVGRKDQTVQFTGLPTAIAARCRAEPRLLIDLVRTEIWSAAAGAVARPPSRPPRAGNDATAPWFSRMVHCPAGVVDLVKARSCRTAVKFNDALAASQCEHLVRRLSRCTFPFQCAHGRPTLTVLSDVAVRVDGAAGRGARGGNDDFRQAWDTWGRAPLTPVAAAPETGSHAQLATSTS